MPVIPSQTLTRAPALQARFPQDVRTIPVRLPPGVTYLAGQVLAEAGNVAARNEVQTLTITGTPTGGSFTISVPNRGTTANIAHNATAATVQTALEAVIGAGNVVCTGGALPGTPVVLTFGNEYGKRDVSLFTTTDALTGGSSPASAIAETTKGSAGASQVMVAVNDAASDGTEKPKGVLMHTVTTDEKGCEVNEWGLSGNTVTFPMAIAGEFQCSLLVGLVANHVTNGNAKQLGRLTSGNAHTATDAVIKLNT